MPGIVLAGMLAGGSASAQAVDTLPRHPFADEPACDSPARPSRDPVYEADAVHEPVQARRLPIEDMPFRAREVISGRSVFRFVVEPSGRIDHCSIEILEESEPAWTAAVLRQLRHARYRAARRGGEPVPQMVYQVFTYHQDGRLLHGR